jgi:hypothetical protein
MKKTNGFLQTFFYDFFKIQVANWVQEIFLTYINIFILKLGFKIIYDFRNLISLNLCSINIFLFTYFYFKSLWLTYK